MIKINLLLAEYMAKDTSAAGESRLRTIYSIKELLSQIDHRVEVVPEDNAQRYTRLLTSLKGEPLNKEETELVEEIVGY